MQAQPTYVITTRVQTWPRIAGPFVPEGVKGSSILSARLEQGPPRESFLKRPPAPRTCTVAVTEKSSGGSCQENGVAVGGIMNTYWHWLEYDSAALAVLFGGIGLVTLLALSI
jgi:hypothetical protein